MSLRASAATDWEAFNSIGQKAFTEGNFEAAAKKFKYALVVVDVP